MSKDTVKQLVEAVTTPRKKFIAACRQEVEEFRQAHPEMWIMKVRDDHIVPVNKEARDAIKAGRYGKRGKGRPVGYAMVFISKGPNQEPILFLGASVRNPRDAFNTWIGQRYAIHRPAVRRVLEMQDPVQIKDVVDDVVRNFSRKRCKALSTPCSCNLYFGPREYIRRTLRRMVEKTLLHYLTR